MEESPAITPVTPVPRKRGRRRLVWLLAAVLVLAGGAGGAWWWRSRTVAAAEPAPDPPLSARGLVTFEPFLVNLADGGGTTFLKINLQLVVGDADHAEQIEKTPVVLMQARSSILELLTQQSAEALVTDEGKQSLKAAIKTRVGPLLPDQKVIDVLFSEFVVQF